MVSSRRSCWRPELWLWLVLILGLTAAPQAAYCQDDAVDQVSRKHWIDFCHYVRIAKPSLAHGAGTALLDRASDEQLVDVVEASLSDYPNWERVLVRAGKTETLEDTAEQLTLRIQAGRILRARDPARIRRDILALAQGVRANMNATERLKSAGEHAVPALLATLLDDTQERLHVYVLNALVAMGKPVVYPLCVALVSLEPVPQAQISRVLAEIGYPRAAPYLKHVVEDKRTDPGTAIIAAAAFAQLEKSARLLAGISAAELHQTLGQNYYRAETEKMTLPGYSADHKIGYVWSYSRATGLIATEVPARIFGSVLARIEALHALDLDHERAAALSLWLMANLRRQNNLGPDERDASYPANRLEPMFYLIAAGPERQHDVLRQALADTDSQLARDAIAALSLTAGTDALVNREGAIQPLLDALSYADRRVRFDAAFALTNARPQEPFEGSDSIVHVLADALRQSATRHALVLGDSQDSTNKIMAMLADLGYESIGATSLQELADDIVGTPGIDLIVTDQSVLQVDQFVRQRVSDYKLRSVPLVVLATPGNMAAFNRAFDRQHEIMIAGATDQASELQPALDRAMAAYAGDPLDAEAAYDYASTALALLAQITLSSSEVFDVYDALPAVIQALGDSRENIVAQAASVIALLDTAEGQQAVADVALDARLNVELRIALLGSLADSANHIGNKLNAVQLDKVLELVNDSNGDLAIAAARAHGALALPTSNIIEMLIAQ
jgi:hypothetical protein